MDFKKLTPESINAALQRHTPSPEGIKSRSAVIVPLIYVNNSLYVIFTKRSMSLSHQPGDICFPGGRQENGESSLDTALRELREELSVTEKNIRILGTPDFFVTPYNGYIVPFIALLENIKEDEIKANSPEVDKIFSVPLSFFMETEAQISYVTFKREFPEDFPFDKIVGGRNYKWRDLKYAEHFYEYNGYVIWGLTARIIRHICYLLKTA